MQMTPIPDSTARSMTEQISQQEAPRGAPVARAAAFSVHIFTALGAGVALLAPRLNLHTAALRRSSTSQYVDPAAQRVISTAQLRRIRSALELYHLERGPFPEQLGALVEVGLLAPEDLHFPWRDSYYYRKLQNGDFILLPPLR